MSKKQRGELEVARDRHRLAQLALSNPGASSSDLAVMLADQYHVEISPRTVRYDLQQLKKQWAVESRQQMELLRAHELRRIDMLEQEAWNAWRASMMPVEKKVVERLHRAVNDAARAKLAGQIAGELADKNDYITVEVVEAIIRDVLADSMDHGEDAETFVHKITTTVEGTVGDPRYLEQIAKQQIERRKVLGVYAPELHQVQMHHKMEVKGYTGGWSPDDWKDDADGDIIDGEVVGDSDSVDLLTDGG